MQKNNKFKPAHKIFNPSLVTPQGFCAGYSEGHQKAALYPALRHCGMTNAASGFTLIELLVVVLIIGILAAVALPQYQKAVLKTHYANAKAMALTYVKAAQTYFLANNAWPTEFAQLDVDLPAGSEITNPWVGNCGINGNLYCCLQIYVAGSHSEGITCGKTDYQIGYFHDFKNKLEICEAKNINTAAISICKEEGGDVGSYKLISPTGYQSGYTSYTKMY